jgi:hypothetical protein
MGDHSVNRIVRKAFAILASTGALAAAHANAQPMPELGKIEFENDQLTVVRMHMAPHERTPMHDIPSARLVIWLTDAHLKDTGADGSVSEYKRLAGSSDWVTPRRHVGENLSNQDLDFLAVIPKPGSAPVVHTAPPH